MKKLEDRYSFNIQFKFHEDLLKPTDAHEPDALLTSITAHIEAYDSVENQEDLQAGYLEMDLLDVERAQKFDTSIYDICDSSNSDLEGNAATFYDIESDELKSNLKINHFTHNSLILQYLLIPKKYRGLGLGKLIIDSVIRNFQSRCDVILLQAVPMQIYNDYKNPEPNDSNFVFHLRKDFMEKMRYDLLSLDEKIAHKKLVTAWKKLGFKTYEKAERGTYMYLPIR